MEYSTDPVYWKNTKGKYVVLVSSDNPWYINTKTTEPVKVIKPHDILNEPTGTSNDFIEFGSVDAKNESFTINDEQPNINSPYKIFDETFSTNTSTPSKKKKEKKINFHVSGESVGKFYDILLCIILMVIMFQIMYLYGR